MTLFYNRILESYYTIILPGFHKSSNVLGIAYEQLRYKKGHERQDILYLFISRPRDSEIIRYVHRYISGKFQ